MKKTAFGLIAIVMTFLALAVPHPAYAVCGEGAKTPKGQVLIGAGQAGNDCKGVQVNNTVSAAVEILSIVVGIAAVIMIIVSGFKYVTSSGDSGSIASAKTTLIYALVGLAIAALAQVLVRFVLNTVK